MRFKEKRHPLSLRQGGFTLLEMMFAMVVIAISVLGLYEMIIQGNNMLTLQKHKRLALEKAQEHLEMMRYWASQYDTVPLRYSGRYAELFVPGGNEEGSQKEITASYVLRVTHCPQVDKKGLPFYSDVSITYSWREPLEDNDQELTLKARF